MKDGVQLRQVLNVIDGLNLGDYEESHAFGEIYETILKEMQSAGSSGEFYTPRALTEFMAEIVNPQIGEKMADFACGTGGFITSWLGELDKKVKTAEDRKEYNQSVFGIEKKQFPYMLCVTNLLLHGIDTPLVYHDNSLTKDVLNYTDGDKFDVVLMNPPYGGNEKSERILGLQNRGIKQWEKIKQENMPLLTWLCKYEESDGNFAKSTLKGRKEMRHKIEQYLATTGDINICLSEIDVDFCRGFVKFLKTAHHGVKKDATAVISQGCAHHHQAVFNGALNKAVREGIIASNPMKLLDAKEKHQPAESVREYLTIDELKAIMKADCANTEVKKAFIFSCFAGLHLGDVRALTWNKVFLASDGKTKFVRTIMEKTNKLVNVPLSKEALNCLNEKEDPNEPIFTLPGTPTICHDIRKWMQNADIKKHISFHCSRHTFATMMLTLGVDIYTTSKLLGHSNVSTTQIYSKIVDEKKVEAVNKVDNLFD